MKFSFSNEKVSVSPAKPITRTWRISWGTVVRSEDLLNYLQSVLPISEVCDLIRFLGDKLDSKHNPISGKMDYGKLCFKIDSFPDNAVTLTEKDFYVLSRHSFILSF